MKRIISKIRLILRKYPLLHAIARRIHIIIRTVFTFPSFLSKLVRDYSSVKNRQFNKSVVWFVNVPSHANMGDQAMVYATRRLLHEQFYDYSVIELSREFITSSILTLKILKKYIKENDLFFVQGGYTSTDKSPNEKSHRIIAKNFRYNRIIFMPQTVKYSCDAELQKTASIYNKHGNILFLCRDQVSFNIVKNAFSKITVILYPDVVASLVDREQFKCSLKRDGILLCIREDSEKNYTQNEINKLKSQLELFTKVSLSDLMMTAGGKSPKIFHSMIRGILEKMSQFEIVITDRFHGILFSIISRTRVIVIDSIDYKVREGAFMFSNLIPGSCIYVDSIDKVPEITKNYLQKSNDTDYSDVIYQNYYKDFRKKYL